MPCQLIPLRVCRKELVAVRPETRIFVRDQGSADFEAGDKFFHRHILDISRINLSYNEISEHAGLREVG